MLIKRGTMIELSTAKAKVRIKAYMRENNCPCTIDKIQERVFKNGTTEELFNLLEDMVITDERISKTVTDHNEIVYFYTYKKKRRYRYG